MQSKTGTELWRLSASQQVSLALSGRVTCRELVESHLERIEAINPRLGAITQSLKDSALAAAEHADRAEIRGPLHGLPFTIKEDIDCVGSPTTHGVPALRNALPYVDAPIVARMKAAGAIPLGRSNLSEMGLRLCTTNPLHGRTLNPYDRRLTVGGSSGGDAVAVVTGMTPVGIGGDLGGSLRVPAACCGCVTLKPTTGRIAYASSLEPRDHGLAIQLMFAPGPLVRSVKDLQLLFPVLAGRDARDPRSVDVPLGFSKPRELVAALVTSIPGLSLDALAVNAVREAGILLESAGWQVEEATPPDITRVNEVFGNLLGADFEVMARQLQPIISEPLYDHLMRLCHAPSARGLSPCTLHSERARLIREWSGFFSDYPVIVGPNLTHSIWPIDADLDPDAGIDLIEQATRFITVGNALGVPSLAMPMGNAGNNPQSILLYADLWREDLCMLAADAIESRRPEIRTIDPYWQ
jgi:amidase